MTARTLAAAVLFVALGTALAQPPNPDDGKGDLPDVVPAKAADKPDIPKLLATRVTVEKAFEGKFHDAVKMLSEKYALPLVVDAHLGESEAMGACDALADKIVKLPKLTNVRLETVVKLLAEQVHGKALAYPDHIKIVPDVFAVYETALLPITPDPSDDITPLLPIADLLRNKPLTKRALVNASFKNKPLGEILDEIAEATGANVTVSPLLPANVRQAPITVRFANAPVDAAVRTLCEMTETGVIEDANVLLITTRERATARAKEEAQKLKDKHPQPQQGAFLGGGLGVPAAAVAPTDAAEIAKLKDQNEQLTKQVAVLSKLVDELQKTVKKLSDK